LDQTIQKLKRREGVMDKFMKIDKKNELENICGSTMS